MDFSSIKPLSFVRRPLAGGIPPGLTTRQLVRRQAMLALAAEIVPHLPGPGESLHALMTGRFDLMALLVVIVEKIAAPCRHLRIATLSFNSRNTHDLVQLLAEKRVERVTLLCSKFFKEHNQSEYQHCRAELAQHPGCRLAAARSHAKVVTLAFADGQRLVIEGSANLRTNSNREQVALFHDAALHDWHGAWIDETVDRATSDESTSCRAG